MGQGHGGLSTNLQICTNFRGMESGKEFRIKFSFRERACGDVGGCRVHSLSVASQTRDGGGALARHGGLWYNSAVFGGRHRRRPREVGRTRSGHADLPRRTTGGRGSCTRAFGASCALARGVPSWNAAAGVAVCVCWETKSARVTRGNALHGKFKCSLDNEAAVRKWEVA